MNLLLPPTAGPYLLLRPTQAPCQVARMQERQAETGAQQHYISAKLNQCLRIQWKPLITKAGGHCSDMIVLIGPNVEMATLVTGSFVPVCPCPGILLLFITINFMGGIFMTRLPCFLTVRT